MRASELTRGEKLRLERWRSKTSQVNAAQARDVSLSLYRRWEADEDGLDIPNVAVGRLALNEQCVLLRWDSGKSVNEIAEDIGCCRLWLRKMEIGEAPIDRLATYWSLT